MEDIYEEVLYGFDKEMPPCDGMWPSYGGWSLPNKFS